MAVIGRLMFVYSRSGIIYSSCCGVFIADTFYNKMELSSTSSVVESSVFVLRVVQQPRFDGVPGSERVAVQVRQIREREAIPRIRPVREQDIAI